MTPPKPIDLEPIKASLLNFRKNYMQPLIPDKDYQVEIPFLALCYMVSEIEYLRARVKELEDGQKT